MKNVSLHILDLVQNSARAKAGKVQISIKEDPGKDSYLLTIGDIKDSNLEIRNFLREMIIENLKEIKAEA